MKNSEIAIWISALAAVALVFLYLMQNDESGGGKVEAVYQVQGMTPEVAAIYSSERIAGLAAKKDVLLGWFSQNLGMKQADNALALGTLQSNNNLALGTIQSNNDVRIGEALSASQIETAKQNAWSVVESEKLKADAAKYTAKQNNKGKNLGAISNIFGTVASFF